MSLKTLVTMACILGLSATASAQNKISGTEVCDKPEQQQMLETGDHPGHMLGVVQTKCTWTGMEIEGNPAKDSLTTILLDSHGNRASARGYDVATMANGDKAFVRFKGWVMTKNGAVVSDDGTWAFMGGTGKLKHLRGEGTYKGKASGEGETFQIEGTYTIPSK